MARLRFRTRLLLIVASVLVVTGAALAVWDSDTPFWEWNSKIKIERDRQPRWQVDPNLPYRITLSHSSFYSGELFEVVIHHDGRVKRTRSRFISGNGDRRTLRWEANEFTLVPEASRQILDAITENHMTRLHRSYEHTGMFDGSSDSFSIIQGEREKKMYCQNHVPEEFVRFKNQLASILARHPKNLTWQEIERPTR